ncbi:ATP-binding cassette domain-containing protein [Rhodococcus sp. T2V]|uniref:ABC transporter ATP-binding protein n=1 Tax=Rhodococcus sp. T2V TaxID=3034164 RepID=UPI0023E149E3|nr:oligopeptide/dipeptide ABC transporter ATP-binding protein [Rhodococcus sp. T2V]MDF3312223.1 ATP-binding cassette domain-containing protein [Rhodococcus sp. T2V]
MAGSGKAHLRNRSDVLLRVEDLVVEFNTGPGQVVHAVSNISLDVLKGETVGVVGESGCGKSTMGRAILQLPKPTSGSVTYGDTDLTKLGEEELRRTRRDLQMILQDPISSLNPRRKVRDAVAEGLRVWGTNKRHVSEKVDEVITAVGLRPEVVGSGRPSQFSGGQCQRICIARALILDPKMIICDEPVSALDVSVQAQIINLLDDMKERYGLTLIFIAHDLAVVKNISDRVVVMYLGKICEVSGPDDLFARPMHHYTKLLMDSIPQPDNGMGNSPKWSQDNSAAVDLPSPMSPPSGCRFRTRCPAATSLCAEKEPQLKEVGPEHFVACHFPRESKGGTH